MSAETNIGLGSAPEGPGGVLSDGAIKAEVDAGRLIVTEFERDSLKPASYDVTAARDALIDPTGNEIDLGSAPRHRRVRLQPGDAAMFSTKETFCLPRAIAGNITIKNRLATQGLMLLSGGLIDPGYGQNAMTGDQRGCRLYMHVANIGRETIDIETGTEQIARIQFLRVCGGELARTPIKASQWREQTKPSLGFLSDLKRLKLSTEGNRDLIAYVGFGGVFVLLMTMLSVALAVILSLSSDAKLVAAAKTAVPQSASGKWLIGTLVLGLSVIACGSMIALWRQARDNPKRRY